MERHRRHDLEFHFRQWFTVVLVLAAAGCGTVKTSCPDEAAGRSQNAAATAKVYQKEWRQLAKTATAQAFPVNSPSAYESDKDIVDLENKAEIAREEADFFQSISSCAQPAGSLRQ